MAPPFGVFSSLEVDPSYLCHIFAYFPVFYFLVLVFPLCLFIRSFSHFILLILGQDLVVEPRTYRGEILVKEITVGPNVM